MRDLWRLGWKLLLISAVAGVLLGATNMLTAGPISVQAEAEAAAAMKAVLPRAWSFAEMDMSAFEQENTVTGVYQGAVDGQTAGYALTVNATGFGGAIRMMVGIDQDGMLQGIRILSHSETPGLGAKATEEAFGRQFVGRELPLAVVKGVSGDGQISAITGATVTSNAVTDAVNRAQAFLQAHVGELKPKEGDAS